MSEKIELSRYKLVISDIDGTIMCSGQTIHAYTKRIIDEIRARGIYFTLASGRSLPGARAIAEELEVDIPIVFANGCILQALDGEVLYHALMPIEISKKVIQITDEHNFDLVFFVDDKLYFKNMTDNIGRIFSRIPESCIEVEDWKNFSDQLATVNKHMILEWNKPERLAALEVICKKEISDKTDFYRTNYHHLEIMPKGISKATGLKELVDHLGINLSEVIAFGDYDNDAALLAAAGLGIAVENATENVKQHADLVIGYCEEQAPAHFLAKLLDK